MASPFASLTKSDPIPLPFDSAHSVVVRGLSGREVEGAQASHARGVAIGRTRIWNQNFKAILEQGLVKAAELSAALNDPLTGFDRFEVVRAGLVSWTYPQPIKATAAKAAVGDTAAVDAYDPIEDASDELVEFIAREVMRRTKPHLFQTADEAETARKNV